MQLGVLGINYKNAPLDIRDKTSFTDEMKFSFFNDMTAYGVEQCMCLSTCNRSEVYFFYNEEMQFDDMRALYCNYFEAVDLKDYIIEYKGENAIKYLFDVAAGIESLVAGEDQILGQVKDALDFSRTAGFSGKELNKVVRDAITCAKKIKTKYKINDNPLSVSYIGIKQLDKICGISGKNILLIGSGKTALLTLKYIKEYENVKITACSRNEVHAKELLNEYSECNIIKYQDRVTALNKSDIVISATSSPHIIIKYDDVCGDKDITFLDLASPRDIDPALKDREGINLINLDTLDKIVKDNQKERQELITLSGNDIDEAVKETEVWLRQVRMDSTIETLQHRCNEITNDSFEYLTRKIPLEMREQRILKKVLNASLQRLIKEPIQELKNIDSEEKQAEYIELIKRLFE